MAQTDLSRGQANQELAKQMKEKEAKNAIKETSKPDVSSRTRETRTGCGSTKKKEDQSGQVSQACPKRERGKQEREADARLRHAERRKRKLEQEEHRVQKQRKREERKRELEYKRERRLRAREQREQERLRRLQWHAEVSASENNAWHASSNGWRGELLLLQPPHRLVHDIG